MKLTQYAYDAAGHRLREKTSTQDAQDATGRETDVAQDNHLSYDELGRLVAIQDGRYSVRYDYDANGNRVHQLTRYQQQTSADPALGHMAGQTTAKVLDRWNAFDAMNRQIIVDGVKDASGNVTIGQDASGEHTGQQITYDSAGRRTQVRQHGVQLVASTREIGGDESSPIYATSWSAQAGEQVETYAYDAAGRLSQTWRDGLLVDERFYDAAGRVMQDGPKGTANIPHETLLAAGINIDTHVNQYDAAGRLQKQTVFDLKSAAKSHLGFHYDSAGNVMARAAMGNALTQGIGVATGMQDRMNWMSVAASGAGAGMGQAVGDSLQGTAYAEAFGAYGIKAAAGFAGGVTTAVARGGKVAVQQVMVDGFGQAIASSLAGQMTMSTPSQPDDPLGEFIDSNMPAWQQRQANYDRMVDVFSQVGGGTRYPGVQVAGGDRDENIARMLRLANEPGAASGPAPYRVEVNGVGWTQSQTTPTLADGTTVLQSTDPNDPRLQVELLGAGGADAPFVPGYGLIDTRVYQGTGSTSLYYTPGSGNEPSLPAVVVSEPAMTPTEMAAFDAQNEWRWSAGGQSALGLWDTQQRMNYHAANKAASNTSIAAIEAARAANNATAATQAALHGSQQRIENRLATRQMLSAGGYRFSVAVDQSMPPEFYFSKYGAKPGADPFTVARSVADGVAKSNRTVDNLGKVTKVLGPIGLGYGADLPPTGVPTDLRKSGVARLIDLRGG